MGGRRWELIRVGLVWGWGLIPGFTVVVSKVLRVMEERDSYNCTLVRFYMLSQSESVTLFFVAVCKDVS